MTYGYDNASNRTTVTTAAGTRTSTFDERNRLLTTTGAGGPDITNTWSARGTLRTSTEAGTTTNYTFDAFEQLTKAVDPGYTVAYEYDSQGRVATRNGIAFGYAGMGNSPVVVPPSKGTTTPGKIFRGPDSQPLSATLAGSPGRSLLSDGRHGDIRGWYDPADGTLIRSAVYNPSGEIVTSTADPLPLGFQGGWSDQDTGLLNASARWYNPESASFVSRDTASLPPDPIAQANRYLYGNGSPLNNVDLTGHNPVAIGAGAIFGISNPIGWIVGIVAVVGVGIASYQGYQAYQNYQASNSASSWGGLNTQTSSYAYQQNAYAAQLNAAAQQAQAASIQALRAQADAESLALRIRINAMNAQHEAALLRMIQAELAQQAWKAEQAREAQLRAQAEARFKQFAIQQAAAIKAATPGPVGTTVVKPPAAVSLAGAAGLTNIGKTVQLPGTVYANSDGTDAPNTAAAAGAVAAVAGLQIAGTKDPSGCDNDPGPREIIQEVAQAVADEGLKSIDVDITPNQRARYAEDGWRIWRDRGHIVHNRTAERLNDAYPGRFTYKKRALISSTP